jgi:hypothetical protein
MRQFCARKRQNQPSSSGLQRAISCLRPSIRASSEDPTLSTKSVAYEFLDSYVRWRDACADVHTAYERWRKYEGPLRGLGFESYRAALDRKERAARIYLEWGERLRA